ncbi:MAG: (d)CMP kinase [Bacteroidota bacterium]
MKKIIIAIDGFAGCGKSTTAQMVADRLDYIYITTGAMYRATTLYFLRENIPFEEENPIMEAALEKMRIELRVEGETKVAQTYLNGEHVELELRTPQVNDHVSQVSVYAMVRKEMVRQQRMIGKEGGIVMDGRDIGTVVFPHAELKIFMKADVKVRAYRRLRELKERGVEISLEKVIENLKERDRIDTTRKQSPLKQAEDAIVIDTTHMSIDEQVNRVCKFARERMKKLNKIEN